MNGTIDVRIINHLLSIRHVGLLVVKGDRAINIATKHDHNKQDQNNGMNILSKYDSMVWMNYFPREVGNEKIQITSITLIFLLYIFFVRTFCYSFFIYKNLFFITIYNSLLSLSCACCFMFLEIFHLKTWW